MPRSSVLNAVRRLGRLGRTALLPLALAASPALRATIVGLNQIVTPDIQPAGVLSISGQAQHSGIGNSQQIQFELGVTPRFEIAWFEGLKPTEGFFSAEYNFLEQGSHLLTAGLINWSTRTGAAQPFFEYGYYTAADHFVAGAITVGGREELLLGYRRQMNERWQFSVDFQSGAGNSSTVGLTYNFTPDFSINPAIYFANSSPHHLFGYVVLTYNLTIWK